MTAKNDPIVRRALDVPRLTLGDLARATGRTRASADKWRSGANVMPQDARKRLARYLERHAQEVREIAEQLREGSE